MTRFLTKTEIENIIDFIKPQKGIPEDSALSIVEINKNKLRKQLKTQKVYPVVIPELKNELYKVYFKSLIQPGESVGVICAQSIGERNTQTTLNSIDWSEKIVIKNYKGISIVKIGLFIDETLSDNKHLVTHIKDNRTEYLSIKSCKIYIPSCDEFGNVAWRNVEAITRHLPVGDLIKVTTKSGRTVTATQSKSFIVWRDDRYVSTNGSDLVIGDMLPSTIFLQCDNVSPDVNVDIDRNDCIDIDHIDIDINDDIKRSVSDGKSSIVDDINIINNIDNINNKRILDNNKGFFIGLSIACGRNGMNNVVFSPNMNKHIHKRLLSMDKVDVLIEKCIPKFIFTGSRDLIIGVIDGYVSYNSCVSNITHSRLSFSSMHIDIINGLSFLLSYFGIFGHISKNSVNIFTYTIYQPYTDIFFKIIKLTNIDLVEKYTKCMAKYEYIHKSEGFDPNVVNDTYLDEVVDIEFVTGTTEYVYDLTVEFTRNFQLFNGLNIRDTFHTAGLSQKTMTTGVPRFKELLNAKHKPSIINYKIYLTEQNDSIQSLRNLIGSKLIGFRLSDLATNMTIVLDKKQDDWYEAYKVLYDDRFSAYRNCISIKLNMSKIFEYRISIEEMVNKIHEEYDDLYCVFSPYGDLDIFLDTNSMESMNTTHNDRNTTHDEMNTTQNIIVCMEEVVKPTIEKILVCGFSGIGEIFYTKENDEWIIETNSSHTKQVDTFQNVLSLQHVDKQRTMSNNAWDIYNVFGIEAIREYLIEEYINIMEGIDECHVMTLVDKMTHDGTFAAISRYTLRKDDSGPMGKAAFEESMDNFMNAAVCGDVEPTKGVSASIICGKIPTIGTGMIDLLMDFSVKNG
jgi:DNA-directed RNA polymerase beta' subunit